MSLCIVDYLEYLSLGDGNTMGANQIRQTVELVLEETGFRCLTIEDYKLFFNQAKKGIFGPIYGRIDGSVIIRWLQQYLDDRCAFFALGSEREADLFRGDYTDEKGAKYVEQLAKKLIENRK